MENLLKFSKGNAKLAKNIYSISLPSGWACPFADKCLSKADPVTGKLQDGKNTEFRCFSATQENIFTQTRLQRQHNFELLRARKTPEAMAELIMKSIPPKAGIVRIHVAGDFFSQAYFDAWILVARQLPNVIFYGYTKSLPYLVARLQQLPQNLRLTASKGGRQDELIEKYQLKYAEVVYSYAQARKLRLPVDHDDSYAIKNKRSFALIIHGTQPQKSEAGKALRKLMENGFTGYNRKNKKKEIKISRAA